MSVFSAALAIWCLFWPAVGQEELPLDKCAGCSAIVDQLYQRVLASVPNDTRERLPTHEVLEILETVCDPFDHFKMEQATVPGYGFRSWYRLWTRYTAYTHPTRVPASPSEMFRCHQAT